MGFPSTMREEDMNMLVQVRNNEVEETLESWSDQLNEERVTDESIQ
jgi:hypothetical protein